MHMYINKFIDFLGVYMYTPVPSTCLTTDVLNIYIISYRHLHKHKCTLTNPAGQGFAQYNITEIWGNITVLFKFVCVCVYMRCTIKRTTFMDKS